MCGFVGFFANSPKKINYNINEVLEKMNETIVHRGPDSKGFFVDDNIALGFRRLSIIDLQGGDQPQTTSDGRYTIVFNGEIYNYKDLRTMLSNKHKCTFSTNSDTETILHIFKYYGEKTASMLRGMFAFVIYDSQEKTLYGARDYFGIKPFFYTQLENEFMFGSEIKSFLPHPNFEKKVNKDALKLYLEFQYVPTIETMFSNVFRLQPGCYFTYSNKQLNIKKYFEPMFEPLQNTDEKVVKTINKTVEESVEYHQIADVEVGSFLSGGVDSSYIASLARPDKTYSIGFNIDGFDETDLAGDLCKILKINNKKRELDPEEFFQALPDIQYFSDEPHANLSAVPLYFLAETAAKDLKVVLSGEGADELFGGYDLYIEGKASAKYNKLPLGFRKFFAMTLGQIPNERISRFFLENSKKLEDTFIGQAFIMDDSLADRLLSDKFQSSITYKDITKPFFDKVKGKDKLTQKMYLDMNLWLPNDILLKADRMTMAHSLELRVPFLDKEVFSVAKTLTSSQKVIGRLTKRLFRTAALSKIPGDWANRKKAGFMVPFKVWITEEKYAAQIRKTFSQNWAHEFFNCQLLLDMLNMHIEGKQNNARVIYTVYSFLLWYEQYFIKR